MTALRERGLRVPDDVSVVGFDDLEEAKFASPPLTTIRQPLYEQGRRATEMLLALMAGEDVPRTVTIADRISDSPFVRLPASGKIPDNRLHQQHEQAKPFEAVIAAQRKQILSDMAKAAGISAASLEPGWAERLLEAFAITLKDPARNDFLQILDEMLRQVGANNGDVMQWRQVLFGAAALYARNSCQ